MLLRRRGSKFRRFPFVGDKVGSVRSACFWAESREKWRHSEVCHELPKGVSSSAKAHGVPLDGGRKERYAEKQGERRFFRRREDGLVIILPPKEASGGLSVSKGRLATEAQGNYRVIWKTASQLEL
jgi:hypothetical protein